MPLIPDPNPFPEIFEKPADAGLELFQAQRLFKASFDFETAPVKQFLKNPTRVRLAQKHFKSYSSKPRFALRPDARLLRKNLAQVISERRTHRDFDGTFKITGPQVASLLSFAAGLKKEILPAGQTQRRNYPSPGGLYSHEIYIVLLKNALGPEGLYHYNVREECLELLSDNDPRDVLQQVCHNENPEKFLNASCVVFMTCIFDRTVQKYGRRGWKFLHFETGVLMQNFYQVAGSLGLGVWPMGNIVEDELLGYLGIDGISEGFMTSLWIGKPVQDGRKSLWTRLTSVIGKSARLSSSSTNG